MHTDAHGSDMSLTEGVIGSAFEVVALLIDFQRPKVEWKRILLDQ